MVEDGPLFLARKDEGGAERAGTVHSREGSRCAWIPKWSTGSSPKVRAPTAKSKVSCHQGE